MDLGFSVENPFVSDGKVAGFHKEGGTRLHHQVVRNFEPSAVVECQACALDGQVACQEFGTNLLPVAHHIGGAVNFNDTVTVDHAGQVHVPANLQGRIVHYHDIGRRRVLGSKLVDRHRRVFMDCESAGQVEVGNIHVTGDPGFLGYGKVVELTDAVGVGIDGAGIAEGVSSEICGIERDRPFILEIADAGSRHRGQTACMELRSVLHGNRIGFCAFLNGNARSLAGSGKTRGR